MKHSLDAYHWYTVSSNSLLLYVLRLRLEECITETQQKKQSREIERKNIENRREQETE
jgi:hypothetical protein